jgi:hypothetical protein
MSDKYHPTAIKRNKMSRTAQCVCEFVMNKRDTVKTILDFGCGRGEPPDFGREVSALVWEYEPNSPYLYQRILPDRAFDLVFASMVLNVIHPDDRQALLQQMLSLADKYLIIGVRTDVKAVKPEWFRLQYNNTYITSKHTLKTIQSHSDWAVELFELIATLRLGSTSQIAMQSIGDGIFLIIKE